MDMKSKHGNEIKDQYESLHEKHERLCREVIFILKDELKIANIKNQGFAYRVKTFDSLYKKIIRKNVSPNLVQDIAGVRVICLYRSDLDKIGEIIGASFDILSKDTFRTRSETQFGYMSDHYIIKLSETCKGKRYDELKGLKCEIQVRTILMDAWASVSHHLDYKKEIDIPSNLRKDFNAVSGLLYAADTHFEIFRNGIEKSKEQLSINFQTNKIDLSQEINLDSLSEYLKWKFPDRERYSISNILIWSQI